MRHQRRVGELIMIASGIGVAIGGALLGILSISYGDWQLQG